jgi:hypothetical protein
MRRTPTTNALSAICGLLLCFTLAAGFYFYIGASGNAGDRKSGSAVSVTSGKHSAGKGYKHRPAGHSSRKLSYSKKHRYGHRGFASKYRHKSVRYRQQKHRAKHHNRPHGRSRIHNIKPQTIDIAANRNIVAGMLLININSDSEIAYDSDMGATQRARLEGECKTAEYCVVRLGYGPSAPKIITLNDTGQILDGTIKP